jgi:hypothetical protein
MATAATAVFIPYGAATNGVSRLPMPKPETEAIAAAKAPTAATVASKITVR